MEKLSYQNVVKKYNNIHLDQDVITELLSEEISRSPLKFVVLDDDPTGVQAVHDVSVFTNWSVESMVEGFKLPEKVFYILTNSRALTEEETVALHREIAENITEASKATGVPFMVISRGDSTLRGHFPLETWTLQKHLMELGNPGADGEILFPYFQAGGRFTIGDIHYVKYGDELVPAGETEFAKDKTFGYKSSDLKEYVEEKTKGDYKAKDVISISLEDLRENGISAVEEKLMAVENFGKIIVNALEQKDVEVFCTALYKTIRKGKKYQFRTAADFVKVVGGITDKPLLKRSEMVEKKSARGGIIVVGSHTNKTSSQLEALKELKDITFLEFNSDLVLEDKLDQEVKATVEKATELIKKGTTVAIYTKRKLLTLENDTKEKALVRSVKISDAVQKLVGTLPIEPAFVVAKGGITSSDVGVKALKVKQARVLGQVQPGIPVWKTGEDSLFPGIPYVIFPGNVGEIDSLKKVVETLTGGEDHE